jgi:hypothetical protein
MERDPLTDPRPGDVVRPTTTRGNRTRCVEERFADVVRFWTPTRYTGRLQRTSIVGWRTWCQKTKAVVVERGD